jgi:hypothetical protein
VVRTNPDGVKGAPYARITGFVKPTLLRKERPAGAGGFFYPFQGIRAMITRPPFWARGRRAGPGGQPARFPKARRLAEEGIFEPDRSRNACERAAAG